jgi:hypothetical protein
MKGSGLTDFHKQIETHYCIMGFTLQILDYLEGYNGRFNALRILEHTSRGFNETIQNQISFPLPSYADMMFHRHWEWTLSYPE